MNHDIHSCGCAVHNAVRIENLSVRLNGVDILKDVSASIPRGLCTAIVGPNGAGKTTLTRALLGEVPYRGLVEFGHADNGFDRTPPRWGYVPQKLAFDREMPLTVLEYLASGLVRRPVFLGIAKRFREKCRALLAEVECEHVCDRRLGALSGGELQRVLLAQALLQGPEVLVLDEPAAGVDFKGEKLCCELLEKFRRERGFTQLMVSHDLATVAAHAAHVICLNKKVFAEGRPAEVLIGPVLHAAFGLHVDQPELTPHGEVCSCSKHC